MTGRRLLIIAILMILTGTGGLLYLSFDVPGNLRPIWGNELKTSFQSNGEGIYYTGLNVQGERIRITEGPIWLYMHGGSCVDCHGVNGRGGIPVMMGESIPSDITYGTLTSENHSVEEEEHPPYTDETIKIAIRDGLNPAGEPLDPTMPRWQMTNNDLDDLLEYLKTL